VQICLCPLNESFKDFGKEPNKEEMTRSLWQCWGKFLPQICKRQCSASHPGLSQVSAWSASGYERGKKNGL